MFRWSLHSVKIRDFVTSSASFKVLHRKSPTSEVCPEGFRVYDLNAQLTRVVFCFVLHKFEGFYTENEPKNLRRPKYALKDSGVTLTLLWFVPVSFQEIQSSLKELALDTYGRKVLIYLLCPRSPAYFHPTIVDLLKKGDENTNRYSKELSLLSIDFYCCFKFFFFPSVKLLVSSCSEPVAYVSSLAFHCYYYFK